MTPELIGIVTVGVALAGIVLVSIRELRGEIKSVHAEIKAERAETNKQFEAMRAETNKQFEAIRGEMRDMRAEITAMRGEMAELRERMARIEGIFEGFLRRDVEPAAAE